MNAPNYTFLQSGEKAVDLTPQFTGPKAVVDLATVQRLARLLPQAKFSEIKQQFVEDVLGTENLERMLEVISDELAFHKSVNLITTYSPPAEAYPQQH